MKYFLLFFIFITISCESQNRDTIFINKFIVVLKNFDETKYNELLEYLEVDTTHIDKKELIDFAISFGNFLETTKYRVISYKELKLIDTYKNPNWEFYNPDIENVYCIMVNENEFFTTIVFNDSKTKIISFYMGLNKNKHSFEPIFLN